MNPKEPVQLDVEERLEVATTRRARMAAAFAVVAWALLFLAFWITRTPGRWIAALVAIACGLGLYEALR